MVIIIIIAIESHFESLGFAALKASIISRSLAKCTELTSFDLTAAIEFLKASK